MLLFHGGTVDSHLLVQRRIGDGGIASSGSAEWLLEVSMQASQSFRQLDILTVEALAPY
jgi:hypothetical protein